MYLACGAPPLGTDTFFTETSARASGFSLPVLAFVGEFTGIVLSGFDSNINQQKKGK
jgi:hypothetical protein